MSTFRRFPSTVRMNAGKCINVRRLHRCDQSAGRKSGSRLMVPSINFAYTGANIRNSDHQAFRLIVR